MMMDYWIFAVVKIIFAELKLYMELFCVRFLLSKDNFYYSINPKFIVVEISQRITLDRHLDHANIFKNLKI